VEHWREALVQLKENRRDIVYKPNTSRMVWVEVSTEVERMWDIIYCLLMLNAIQLKAASKICNLIKHSDISLFQFQRDKNRNFSHWQEAQTTVRWWNCNVRVYSPVYAKKKFPFCSIYSNDMLSYVNFSVLPVCMRTQTQAVHVTVLPLRLPEQYMTIFFIYLTHKPAQMANW